MFRLLVIARGIDRGSARGLWPGDGLIDERLLTIARNFTQAGALINNSMQQDEPSPAPGGWADLADGRTQTMHVLYVTAHGVTVGLAEHAAMVAEQLRRDSLRKVPTQVRFDPKEPDAARAMISRLDVFEQIAGHYLFGTNHGRAGESATSSVTGRLTSALAVWDIQAHRSLAAQPSPPNLACVARVQALIATASGVISEAAAQTSLIDSAASERFATLIDTSQLAWTRAADRWSELVNPAARTDPKLLGAASEVRAAIAASTHNQTGWASADLIASRIDLPAAVGQLQLSTAAAVDMAHVTRDIALTEPTLTASARTIAMRTQADAERAIDHGERRYLGVDWVTAGDVRSNRIIPLPDAARRGLVDTANHVIATVDQAAAAAATLTPSERAQPARATGALDQPDPYVPMSGRPAETRNLSGRNPTPEGPRR